MLRALLQNSTTPLLQQTARFAERRQEVLAGNIANIDTPGYRQRDLPVSEFRAALRSAVARLRHASAAAGPAASLHPPPAPLSALSDPADLFPAELFQAREPNTQPGITFQDANNRSIEHQFLELTKNSILQNFALELLRNQYDQLQTAISERVA